LIKSQASFKSLVASHDWQVADSSKVITAIMSRDSVGGLHQLALLDKPI